MSSGVSRSGEGNSQGIVISTNNLTLTNGGKFDASTQGQGSSGLIDITATGDITIDGENSRGIPSIVLSEVFSSAEGNSQGITISTNNLTLTNGGMVDAGTQGQGSSGLIDITATGDITIDGEGINGFSSGLNSRVNADATGDAGGVNISTTNLNLTNGGVISASTFGQGNAGSIDIITTGDTTIDGEGIIDSSVSADVTGNAGGVNISTTNLNLTNGGRINASTQGQGNGGAVSVTAMENIVVDESDISSRSSVLLRGVDSRTANSGEITISATNLSLINGGRVDTTAIGEGSSGKINVVAKDNIFVEGEDSEGFPSIISSRVNSIGDSGGITISTTNLSLTEGGQVSTATAATGNAGSLTIDASGNVFISGKTERFRSGISANAINKNGNASNINITTEQLTISNGGIIEASNFDILEELSPGVGEPGNIIIEANSIKLANQANINTATQSETGNSANIDLTVTEDLILQNNSLISAEARENAVGGNITINANDGFILAFPNQNNDIIANASRGNGGAINIDTQAIFGLEERLLNPITNDINASSEATGLDGTVEINNPAVDPTTGLINLPASVGDASDQISQNPCQQGVGSEFRITGKGGLPPTVNEALNSESSQVSLVESVPSERKGDGITKEQEEANQSDIPTNEAVPAMGWVFNDQGEVTLTAYSTTDTQEVRSPATPNTCNSNNPN